MQDLYLRMILTDCNESLTTIHKTHMHCFSQCSAAKLDSVVIITNSLNSYKQDA